MRSESWKSVQTNLFIMEVLAEKERIESKLDKKYGNS